MTFIYILYTLVIALIIAIIYLIFDYYQVRKTLLEIPEKLQLELDEKTRIYEKQQVKLSNLWEIQHKIESKVLQIDWYLKSFKELTIDNEKDLQSVRIMELNTRFTIEQINKSMNFIQEMKNQENK